MHAGYFPAGRHQHPIEHTALSSGMYVMTLVLGEQVVVVRPFVVMAGK